MSDIDTQIAQIEKEIEQKKTDLNRYQEQVKRLEVEIEQLGNKFKTLSQAGRLDNGTKKDIAKDRITKRKQIDSYKKMINEVKKQITNYEKVLKGLKPNPAISMPTEKIEKSDDPFSRLYDTSGIVPDETTERDLEELMNSPLANTKAIITPDIIEEKATLEEAVKQQRNLYEREKAYEDKTGKKYNPLVTDDDEYVTLSEPSVPKPSVSSSKTRRKTPTPPIEIDSTPTTEKNKTKKKRPTPEGIELDDLSRIRETPEQVPLKNVEIEDEYFRDFKKDLTPTPEQVSLENNVKIDEKTGFSETLVKPSVKAKGTPNLDKNVCKNIFENGSKDVNPSSIHNRDYKRKPWGLSDCSTVCCKKM